MKEFRKPNLDVCMTVKKQAVKRVGGKKIISSPKNAWKFEKSCSKAIQRSFKYILRAFISLSERKCYLVKKSNKTKFSKNPPIFSFSYQNCSKIITCLT